MPRIYPPERLRIYTAATDLTRESLVTLLLPCLFQQPPRIQKHVYPHFDSRHIDPKWSAPAVERLFTSTLCRVAASSPHCVAKSTKDRFPQKRDCPPRRYEGRRWFSTWYATKRQTEHGGTQSMRPIITSGSAATISASDTKHDGTLGTHCGKSTLRFRSLHNSVHHTVTSAQQHASTNNTKLLSEEARVLLELKDVEDTEPQLNNDTRTGTGQEAPVADAGSRARSAAVIENYGERHETSLKAQIKYLKTVRELEEKLGKARHDLHQAMKTGNQQRRASYWDENSYREQRQIESMHRRGAERTPPCRPAMKLGKEDFLGLVDLYFYSHHDRFLSESPDSSPTPLQLDDYSFRVSEDFSLPTNTESGLVQDEEGTPVSPLHHVGTELKAQKLDEIKKFQRFVDLLLDDYSPLRDLFLAYKALPQPGVLYLSSSVTRLFLQRMSTPWRRSETAMMRYLSLMDDMQHARLPIAPWEWSSAIHLAGNSFYNVSNTDVAAALRMWRIMEKDAGVAARDVTFNILFDIAVKGEKFILAEEILKEMHDRGFRLNRLGRVSLIYYYGRRSDGDGVRKAYRDFVEAGEIVDTLVLNCVMASLINAQEPAAAEQVYERMKGMQERLRKGINADGEEALFIKYPPPGPDKIGAEAASNALGRVLLHASRLKTILPEHHAELQDVMPLTPNTGTYRTLMTHHAKTSGNIDRVTVLIDDMTRVFGIPVTQLTFQLLFMGFARHGGSVRSDARWTRQRLQITWAACLACMKAGESKKAGSSGKKIDPSLPSLKDAEGLAAKEERRANEEAARREKKSKPTGWDTFFQQFTYPYPQTQPSNVYPATLDPSESPMEGNRDREEDYHLPDIGLMPETNGAEDTSGMNAIRPSKHLVTWIMRAFARCTANRQMLEDIWHHLKRIWRPVGPEDKAIAVRELRRALAYCDTHGAK